MSLYNAIHGRNPLSALWLAMLGMEPGDVPRFRDVYLGGQEGDRRIGVYTRMGGGNRGHWDMYDDDPGRDCSCPGCRARWQLGQHPLFLYDEDDDFDRTYATYWYEVPDVYSEYVEELAALGGQTARPEDEMLRILKKMEGAESPSDDPEIEAAMEAMSPVLEKLVDALGESTPPPEVRGEEG